MHPRLRHATVILLAVTMMAGGAAAAVGDTVHADQATQSSPRFSQFSTTDGGVSLLDQLLSFVDPSKRVLTPGESLTLEYEVDSTEAFDGSNVVWVVEIYDCNDTDCSDNDNRFVEAVQKDFPDSFSATGAGATFSSSVEYTVPGDASANNWAATAYLWHTGEERLVSDSPVEEFTVTAASDDTGGGGSNSGAVNIVEARSPEVTVTGNTVTGTVTLRNTGEAGMQRRHIVEMQVRPDGAGPLSFVSQQRVCDPDHPENVHKAYQLDAGEQRTITLQAEAPAVDQRYDVFFMTRNGCHPATPQSSLESGEFERVDPYRQSTQVPNVCVGDCSGSGGNTEVLIGLGMAGLVATVLGGVLFLG